MGEATDWQSKLVAHLDQVARLDLVILNPRRADWDSSWEQSIECREFREQVQWELSAQETADVIAMYFDPQTKAPITLLELGLFAASGKVIVCCPAGYWRRGNIEVVCDRYDIPLLNTLDQLMIELARRFSNDS